MPISRRLGIRGRLILNVLALVALSLWLLGVVLLRQSSAFLAAEREARGRVIATAVEQAFAQLVGPLGTSLAAGARAAPVRAVVASFAQAPGIARIVLRDATGELAADAGREPAGGLQPLAHDFPLRVRGVPAGTLTVAFSPQETGRRAAYAYLQVLVQLGITALVLVIFLNLMISVFVVRPIRRLAAAAERIAGGDLERPVERGRDDEVGDLAAAFEGMRLRLHASRELDRRRLEDLGRAHAELVATGDQLVRSERLAAVGSVAASVAHEVGNPLAAVTGYLAMARDAAGAGEARGHLDRAEREVRRIDRIMRDLLEYARPPRMEWTQVDLNALLRDLAQQLRGQPDFAGVGLSLEQAARLPAVRADYHRTRQLLLNLALNAAQALGGRGEVRLESFLPAAPGRAAGVRVRDDGPGIPPEVLARLFEPFVTAGKGARGTGLGLAICRRTAEAMGATLEVETAPAAGTTFTVLFPAPQDDAGGPAGPESR